MRLPRVSVAMLCILVMVFAVDCAWLRHLFITGKSLLLFDAFGFDLGVLPMVNILAYGLYRVLLRRGQVPHSLLGFEVGGLVAILTYMVCSWVSPDTVRAFVDLVDPIWRLYKPSHPPEIIEAPVLMAYVTLPQ